MLTSNTLAQLSGLKKEIRSSKNLSEGVVRGTTGRYGFVTLDDGRDVYLSADMMDRVFQGDRVEVSVKENEKKQLEGTLEKLIQSPLKRIAGQYKIKGKGHFVAYHDNGYNRWVFVPPKERAKSKDGDYVTAKITQHPFSNGKSQAKILKNLGTQSNAATIRQLAITQHQLFDSWPKEVLDEVKQLQEQSFDKYAGGRTDLTEHHFITIDAASTLDMDDAITITASDDGWQLMVAIADPACEINEKSSLYKIAAQRAQTLYFPGKSLPMLPEVLSTQRYSLMAGKQRLSIVCKLTIDKQGKTNGYEFMTALIESKAKLSYQQASQFITDGQCDTFDESNNSEPLAALLKELHACSVQQQKYRQEQQLVLVNRPDFSMRLNKQGKLESIERIERGAAHQIVEECMIATNQCAGKFLAQHSTGIFSTHAGYKEERREDVQKLLTQALGSDTQIDTQTLLGYSTIIKKLQSDEQQSLLLSKQQRFQSGSELSSDAKPHFGLGAQYYATVTSPIRRFQDLYNQRCIHQILQKKKASPAKNSLIEKTKSTLNNNYKAVKFMQLWLIADYMESRIGEIFTGKIALLTNQGVGVRLIETGIEGFIAATKEDKKNPEKPYDKLSFNNQRLELSWNEQAVNLDQEVEVRLLSIDDNNRKLAFEWAEKPS